jgi:hypothetical protein
MYLRHRWQIEHLKTLSIGRVPGHHANILKVGFRKVGIGVMDGGIFGKMFVQEFTD